MRRLARGLAFAAAVAAGCARHAGGASDLAAPPAAGMSCAALQGCVQGCPARGREACVAGCVARVSPAARPYYEALERCVVPACVASDGGAAPCREPTSFACTLCAMAHCPQPASRCMAH